MKRSGMIATGLAIVITFLCGCNKSGGIYKTSDEVRQQQSETIIETVVNKDTAALKEIFCKYIKNTHDLDSEIANFFDFIDGEIITYDAPSGGYSSKSTTPEGTKESRFGEQIQNIKTDSGKTYKIGFHSYYAYDENEDYVGVILIGVQDTDTYDEETGYEEVLIGEDIEEQ